MAHGVLGIAVHLCECKCTAFGSEHRIIAESLFAAWRLFNMAVNPSFEEMYVAAKAERYYRAEMG